MEFAAIWNIAGQQMGIYSNTTTRGLFAPCKTLRDEFNYIKINLRRNDYNFNFYLDFKIKILSK